MYKVGDEVCIKAVVTNVNEGRDFLYCVKILNDVVMFAKEEHIAETSKTYTQGFADAWKLAGKLVFNEKNGGFSVQQIEEIFGTRRYPDVFRCFTAEEALAKIEAYGKSKKLCVGDEVTGDKEEPTPHGVITRCDKSGVYVMWNDGSCGRDTYPESLKKTGKHINIENFLKQLMEQ